MQEQKFFSKNWLISIFCLIFINFIAFIWNLGSTGLVDETEPLFAEAARQMFVTGDWITPYFNGETRFDKPALIYWLMAVCYQLIGVNEWAARLPSALAATALTIFGFFTLRYFGFATPKNAQKNEDDRQQLWQTAWLGATIIAFNLETILWARSGVSDMLLSACIGSALFCFFWGYVQENKNSSFLPNKWYLAFYIFLGLSVLTKGPVGLVLPGLIIGCFLIYLGNFFSVLREIKLGFGCLLFLLITLPWYILVTLKNGQNFLGAFFGYHNFDRFTSVVNGHAAPWYFYFLIVLALFAPWSIYLPLSLMRVRIWRRSFWQQQPRYSQLSLFAFFWFVCIFIFFSISITKLPSYVLPLMPAAAILVTLLWIDCLDNSNKKEAKFFLISIILNILLAALLSIGFFLAPQFIGKDPAITNLRELLQQSGLPLTGGIIWGIAALFITVLTFQKKHWHKIIFINLIAFLLLIIFVLNPAYFFVDRLRQLPLRKLSQTIVQVQQPAEELWMIGFKKPTIVFYSQRQVKFFKNQTALLEAQKTQLNTLPNSSSALILTENKYLRRLKLQPQDYQSIDNKGNYQLIRMTQTKLRQLEKNRK